MPPSRAIAQIGLAGFAERDRLPDRLGGQNDEVLARMAPCAACGSWHRCKRDHSVARASDLSRSTQGAARPGIAGQGRKASRRLNSGLNRRCRRQRAISVGGVAIAGLAHRRYQAPQTSLKGEDSRHGLPQFIEDGTGGVNRGRP
jgi:hypothetical protein